MNPASPLRASGRGAPRPLFPTRVVRGQCGPGRSVDGWGLVVARPGCRRPAGSEEPGSSGTTEPTAERIEPGIRCATSSPARKLHRGQPAQHPGTLRPEQRLLPALPGPEHDVLLRLLRNRGQLARSRAVLTSWIPSAGSCALVPKTTCWKLGRGGAGLPSTRRGTTGAA